MSASEGELSGAVVAAARAWVAAFRADSATGSVEAWNDACERLGAAVEALEKLEGTASAGAVGRSVRHCKACGKWVAGNRLEHASWRPNRHKRPGLGPGPREWCSS
jgi:hypothetical protein